MGHVKAVLKGRFVAIQAYLKKQEKSQINNLTLHLKQLEKKEMKNPRVGRWKEILTIRAEINVKETKATIAKINKAKSWFFEKINKIDKPLARLTEAEDIKKRWQEYTEELYKKDLHDPDNHDGVITHLEPDILECEVKWALESITTNKASGGDAIPVELFQILKDDAVKVLHSVCQQIWKTQQWPQDQKRSVFFPIPKKGNAKECSNYRTTALI